MTALYLESISDVYVYVYVYGLDHGHKAEICNCELL